MPFERHVIFGTAGHVDHGKSALVLALTGTDPDRLAEEKAREMTIDLGFAFLSLPGIEDAVAIVDVPGHEMFVRNMVAGATGVDAAIFVVAADEGVMPQTVEHLEVLRQLGLSAGVVALTKIDKVATETVHRVSQELRELAVGTFLEHVPIVPVSSRTGEGLPELREELARIAANVTTRSAEGIFRLPIDRVFTLRGVGTVITGTVVSGSLRTGETVTCLPQGRDLRARTLQVHDRTVERVVAGQRAAVNLPGVAKEDLQRGDVLATPGSLAPSLMLDARLHLSPAAPRALEQRARLRVHHGTREVMARLVLLEGDQLAPGASALVQLRLESPLVPAAGDNFVIRSYSPMLVIGGGTIVDPHPPKRAKAKGAAEVAEREELPLQEAILDILERAGARGLEFDRIRLQSSLPAPSLRSALEQIKAEGCAHEGRRGLWFSGPAFQDMKAALLAGLAGLHAQRPLLTSLPLNEVAAPLAHSPGERECFRLALNALAEEGEVTVTGERLRLSSHLPQWRGREAEARETILRECRESGLAAPSVHDLAARAGLDEQQCRRLLEALVNAGDLHPLASDIYLHPEVITRSRARVQHYLAENGTITVPQCRDLLGASRKYLLPFLEQLDREGVTVRRGDYRVLAGGK
jgi:selenocysteine-specific elongation factor